MFTGTTRARPGGPKQCHLSWSEATVKKYVQRVLDKLGIGNRTRAAVEAVRRGLLT